MTRKELAELITCAKKGVPASMRLDVGGYYFSQLPALIDEWLADPSSLAITVRALACAEKSMHKAIPLPALEAWDRGYGQGATISATRFEVAVATAVHAALTGQPVTGDMVTAIRRNSEAWLYAPPAYEPGRRQGER